MRQESAALKRQVAQWETILLRHEVAILKRQLAQARAAKPDEEAAKLRKRVRELQARLRELADAARGTVFMPKGGSSQGPARPASRAASISQRKAADRNIPNLQRAATMRV